MASRVKITISIDKDLVRELAGAGRQRRKSRSRLVEEALQHWRRSRLEQELKAGYLAMAKADRATAERNLAAGWEAIK
jgi:metal-responsive CopG/Arc/MetJ family transcriptional regulator